MVELMNKTFVSATSTSYGSLAAGLPVFYWDADQYDNDVEVYFEATLKIGNASATAYVSLRTSNNTLVTDTELSTQSTTTVRIRSANILSSLVDGETYHIRMKSSSGYYTATAYNARLIIVKSGTIVKTETLICLSGQNQSPTTDYVALRDKFTYDADKFDGVTNIYFEFSGYAVTGTDLTVHVVNQDGTEVTDSELTISGNVEQLRVRSAALTLTDGDTYNLELKKNSTGSPRFNAGYFIIQQTNPTKTESVYTIYAEDSINFDSTTTYIDTLKTIYWDDDEWDVTTMDVYFEAVIQCGNSTKTTTVGLYDGAAYDSEISLLSTTITVVRSTALNLDDNTNYGVLYKTSTTAGSNSRVVSARLIIDAEWSSGGTTNYGLFAFFMGM